ncbi:dTDP-4-dehydrorhamnose reductase [Candidatus Peregrinibacteria bacterium]|nr:dTDP-4-dehydrorhamnose reductase [Candidatus Peregrinibacteria bacterium]
MNVLLIGKNGMLGWALEKALQKKRWKYVALGKNELDITNEKKVEKTLEAFKPNYCINAAAFTDVDGSEEKKKEAMKINAYGPGYIAKACLKTNTFFIHYSTDYVFNGKNEQGYTENNQINPINTYGKSKAYGERLIKKNIQNYAIIRTSWLFGPNGKNFVTAIKNISHSQKKIPVVSDQKGSPTYTIDISEATMNFLKNPKTGIFHLTNSGITTWAEYAEEIIRLLGKSTMIKHVTNKNMPRKAKRPQCSILINTKLPSLRPWKKALKHYIDNYA